MKTNKTTTRSRWGYHPCTFDIYRKLKYLKKKYWLTIRQFHAWHRWWRKEPQNRRGNQPSYCPFFVEHRTWFKRTVRGGHGYFKVYPRTVVGHEFCEWLEWARTPEPEPCPMMDVQTIEQIEAAYLEVTQYFGDDSWITTEQNK